MTVSKEFNIYCDESCHLENDNIPVMALGAVSCERRYVRELSNSVRRIKAKFGLSSDFEIKWTKVSPAKERFYLEVIELFLTITDCDFEGLLYLIKRKSIIHNLINRTMIGITKCTSECCDISLTLAIVTVYISM